MCSTGSYRTKIQTFATILLRISNRALPTGRRIRRFYIPSQSRARRQLYVAVIIRVCSVFTSFFALFALSNQSDVAFSAGASRRRRTCRRTRGSPGNARRDCRTSRAVTSGRRHRTVAEVMRRWSRPWNLCKVSARGPPITDRRRLRQGRGRFMATSVKLE